MPPAPLLKAAVPPGLVHDLPTIPSPKSTRKLTEFGRIASTATASKPARPSSGIFTGLETEISHSPSKHAPMSEPSAAGGGAAVARAGDSRITCEVVTIGWLGWGTTPAKGEPHPARAPASSIAQTVRRIGSSVERILTLGTTSRVTVRFLAGSGNGPRVWSPLTRVKSVSGAPLPSASARAATIARHRPTTDPDAGAPGEQAHCATPQSGAPLRSPRSPPVAGRRARSWYSLCTHPAPVITGTGSRLHPGRGPEQRPSRLSDCSMPTLELI